MGEEDRGKKMEKEDGGRGRKEENREEEKMEENIGGKYRGEG